MVKAKQRKTLTSDIAKGLLKELKEVAESLKGFEDQKEFMLKPTNSYERKRSLICSGDAEALYLLEHDLERLRELVEKFWLSDEEVTQTVSKQTIEKEVIDLIGVHRLNSAELDEASIYNIFANVKLTENRQWQVFRPLYGITLSTDRLTLGSFTFYTWKAYQLAVSRENLMLELARDMQWKTDAVLGSHPSEQPLLENLGNLLISVQVEARDQEKAIELADKRFYQFEDVISYMIADSRAKNIRIFNYLDRSHLQQVLVLHEQYSCFVVNEGTQPGLTGLETCDLNSPFFSDGFIATSSEQFQYWVNSGHSWVWEALNSLDLTERQKRVVAAIEWVGKGVRDNDLNRALVQYTFALETLFTLDRDAVTNQLAEFSAFVIGSNPELRRDTAKKVKEVYGFRSAIAHGRGSNVSASEVAKALKLVKSLITQLITNPELSIIATDQEFRRWCDSKKYA